MKTDAKIYSLNVCILLCLVLINSCTKLEKVGSVTTGYVTDIKASSVEVSGTIIDLGEGATGYGFCYGKAPNVTLANRISMLGVPFETGNFKDNIPDLDVGTKYYYKAYLSYGSDIVFGKELSFISYKASLPSIFTMNISGITSNSAGSGGGVTSDGGAEIVACGVCWSLNHDPSHNDAHTSDTLIQGVFSSSITGLSPGKSYFVRSYAINSIDTAYGNELTFTTQNITSTLPSSTISDVTNVTNTSASVSGEVLANGSHTTVVFEYGVSGQFPSSISAVPDSISGTSITMVNAELNALTPGTLYSVRIKAVNADGTSYSNILTFITSQMPFAETEAATDIKKNSAKLIGSVNSFNAPSTVTFQYGLTVSYGSNVTASQSPVTGSTLTDVSADISGLSSDRTYHFRIKAESSGGTIYGEDKTFKTSR